MGIKDEVLLQIRDDYHRHKEKSFLYKYILEHNEKLEKKLRDTPDNKREATILKSIQDTMINYGYPLSYKESTKEKTSNPPLEMVDAWYEYKGTTTGSIEEFDRLYKSICKSESSDSILIPVRVDSETGVGLYIIGKDYYRRGYFTYPQSIHCGIDFISNWKKIDSKGIFLSITYAYAYIACTNVKEVYRDFYNEKLDCLEELGEMNGHIPADCPEKIKKYFKAKDSEDKK